MVFTSENADPFPTPTSVSSGTFKVMAEAGQTRAEAGLTLDSIQEMLAALTSSLAPATGSVGGLASIKTTASSPNLLRTCGPAALTLLGAYQKSEPLAFPGPPGLRICSLTRAPGGSSCCGSVVGNLTSIQEDAGSIPGLNQGVKDPVSP